MRTELGCLLLLLLVGAGQTHALPPARKTLDLGNGIKMEFVLVPSNSFMMGSSEDEMEAPVHKVTITKAFYMGKYEVAQEQWEQVCETNPSRFKGEKNPVESISWLDCEEFLADLNEMASGKGARLPTEAEWEYACRAGSTNEFCCAGDGSNTDEYGWFGDNSKDRTHPVGKKKPNAWGLYDMHGNVAEWCSDWFGPVGSSEVETDPVGPPSGTMRVLRGGDYDKLCWCCARRSLGHPQYGNEHRGFRVVLPVR